MRLRNIPASYDAVTESPYVIHDPLHTHAPQFDRSPLHVEIGMGKGQFLLAEAAEHPQIQYIGMERYTSVLYRALQKMEEPLYAGLKNLSFLCEDAVLIDEIFPPESINVIYLNFSDPWPKRRHARRRLTSRQFLSRYQTVLANDGRVEMKTDNTALFQFTLDELSDAGWNVHAVTWDLHHDPVLSCGNHMTEYEEKFSAEGHPICKVIASVHPA